MGGLSRNGCAIDGRCVRAGHALRLDARRLLRAQVVAHIAGWCRAAGSAAGWKRRATWPTTADAAEPRRRALGDAGRTLSTAEASYFARWCAHCRREFFVVAAPPSPAAAPAMLRRVSDDVVTAGLNSFRVWFGPVPGSP
ncbi:chromodomain-helicase-DNA-binding protein, putati (ISS) [Dorcoceras hygrometricum]|uniref:Chromodomain-helicase-DNA-binding protein, putati (ISS) n=1 Tax=Dorcoceras hygrometricum TaxID=472368 RepID=A0A2Z6ZWN8_9LAMI|nr:chromodomain-helicase-DNA-binding protein, putati (ISS) [Dorcoceras hygrometricum]